MNILLGLTYALIAVTARIIYVYLRRRNTFLKKLQGPESSSFWIGNESEIRYQREVGDNEFKWMRQYGSAWRRSGPLGVDYLSLADPKALQYVLHTSGYHFPKGKEVTQNIKLIIGQGVVWAHGADHQRQRKIMTPAFFAPQLRSFLPLFQNSAMKLAQKWKDEILSLDTTGQPVVNVSSWLSRTTLDVIGETGFDFQFGSLDNEETLLGKLYDNLFIDSTLYPSRLDVVFKACWRYIPEPLLHYVRYLPAREYRRFRKYLDYVRSFARDLVKESMVKGDGNDVMSVLLRANSSEDPNSKMYYDELIDQISTLILAGHDTTSNTLTWFLWEIAKHPESQKRIREEIAAIRLRGGGEQLSATDLDSMLYTQAALKESMRLHPIIWMLRRVAGRDDVIPLAFPITTKSGEQISSIPVKKGTPIDIFIDAYNRLPEVWGPDADEWNPDRFLDQNKKQQISLGVFANLLNFSGGLRACLGWRFAVLEMQVIAVTLLENFEFSPPPESEKTRIYRKPGSNMMPMTENGKRAWMGLEITALE
ncbi:cytochrome P450 [Multifurca ochricompacta]|uniref:Cytochrome P450 n=1 Tax=Multifurca ochricompacta TaxID=376703 RepID=A0AAD4LXS5_9AGAM|nr:cytochrome P450 [Multifurca ochricompacta]